MTSKSVRSILRRMIEYFELWLLLRYVEKASLKRKISDNKKTKDSYGSGDNVTYITTNTTRISNIARAYSKRRPLLKKEKVEWRLKKAEDFGLIGVSTSILVKNHVVLTDKGKKFTFSFTAYLQLLADEYPILLRLVFETGILAVLAIAAKLVLAHFDII